MSRRRRTFVSRGIVPNQKLVKMRWAQNYILFPSVSIGVTSMGFQSFRLTSINDPDFTTVGTNHRPLGYDQMEALYSKYVVLGGKLSAYFIGSGTNTTEDINQYRVGIHIPDANGTAFSPTTQASALMERRAEYKWKYLTGSQSGKSTANVSRKWSTKKIFDVSKAKDEDDLKSGFGFDPSLQVEGTVFALGMPFTASPALKSLFVDVVIDYVVLVLDPNTLAQS